MDKIHDFEVKPKTFGKASANENVSAESTEDRISIPPPTFQFKTDKSSGEVEEKEETATAEPAYQLAAEGREQPTDPSPPSDDPPTPNKPNNTGLPTQLKSGVESLSGFSLDDVSVHYNSSKPAQLQAHAYAQGSDIHLGPGQERHLPHEAWHVVQQKQGRVQATTQMKGIGVNDDSGLEKEADVMGAKAMQMKTTNLETPYHHSAALQTANMPVQGKFGFELELPIAISSQKDGPNQPITLPSLKRDEVVLADTDNGYFQVNEDHLTKLNMVTPISKQNRTYNQGAANQGIHNAPIIEFVTAPLDEFKNTEEDVKAVMNDMKTVADDITLKTTGLTKRVKFNTINSIITNDDVYIGSDQPFASQIQSTDAMLQVTYGLSLKQVPEEFEHRSEDPKSQLTQSNKDALSEARVIGQDLTGLPGIADISVEETIKEIKGFMTLTAYYLLMGKINPDREDLIKKKVGLFYYKTKLSTLSGNIMNRDLDAMSLFVDYNAEVIDWLMLKTGRQKADHAITGLPFTCEDWLSDVIYGLGDKIFDNSVNPYSSELTDDSLGIGEREGTGVVVENREYAKSEGNFGGKYAPSQWETIGLDTYHYLRKRNGGIDK